MQSGIVIGANLVRWPFCQEIAKYKINESSLVNTGQLIGVYMLIGLTRIKIKGLGIKVGFFFTHKLILKVLRYKKSGWIEMFHSKFTFGKK